MIVRTGYYNGDIDDGWGFDKAYWKHDIHEVGTILFALRSPFTRNRSDGSSIVGGGYNWYSKAEEWEQDFVTGKRRLKRYQGVNAVWDPREFTTYKGVPAGNPLGLVTAFCSDDDNYITECDDWVDKAASFIPVPD